MQWRQSSKKVLSYVRIVMLDINYSMWKTNSSSGIGFPTDVIFNASDEAKLTALRKLRVLRPSLVC